MLFSEALEVLQKGKYVCRPLWKDKGEYVVFMPGMASLWKIMTQPQPNAGNWLPLLEDLIATDWEVIEKV